MSATSLQRLRKNYALADLPDTIATGEATAKPIEKATVDDVAFALQALNDQASAIINRASALRSLHDRARRAGAVGSVVAIDAAAKTLEGAQ